MLPATGLIATVVLTTAFLPGCNGRTVLTVARNTTINLVCTDGTRYPTWFVNGITVGTGDQCNRISFSNEEMVTATLTIDGNYCICDTLNIHCEFYVDEERRLVSLHNTTLTIQGHLPSPENVHINETVNIKWNPPYYSVNNDVIHVDPHITHYTVYITDIYTGNTIKETVTETQFTFNTQEDDLCPMYMYQVSAWNAGGEGELSEPVQGSTPRVPHSITDENVSVAVTEESNAFLLNIHINVDISCLSRIPEFFLVTLITSAGDILKESNRSHESRQAVADFTVSLPQGVDVCSLHLRIRAGNSAGVSAPSEAVEVYVCLGDNTESTTTASTTVTVSPTTASTGNRQQGDNTILIAVIIGVIAAVGVVLIVAVGIICCLKYKCKNSKVDPSDQTDDRYSKSPSLGGPAPTQVVSNPESTSITDSEGSNDNLLQPSLPTPMESQHLVYAQVDLVKQTHVQPPANDDPVQYAQIELQDKL